MSHALDDYDFELPEELIAQFPASPKESARLLVYDRKRDTITHATVADLPRFIPEDAALVLNDTRVIKARLFGTKASGGKIELLFQKPLGLETFLVNIRGRVKEETRLLFDDGLQASVVNCREDGTREVVFYHGRKRLDFNALLPFLERIGHVPLPPYIKRDDTAQDSKDYQTLFARKEGAVAAPTASLHFSEGLFETLRAGHPVHYLTLHVGIGTFKPVETEDIRDHAMHSEYYEIPERTAALLDSDTPLMAVGTTVTRTVEYYVRTGKTQGECDLFLTPENPPRRVDHLLTNFHLPKSTLVMLVSAFVGRETMLRLYKEAVAERYRFFSYGDAMLIL